MTQNSRCFIFNFHGIGDYKKELEPGEEKVWIDKKLFSEICRFASERNDITITFDDGNISDFEIALPELLKNKIKGIFFIVADRIGKPHYMKSTHLISMKQNGMIIGSHGMYHRSWRGLSDKELDIELIDARNKIEDIIGNRIIHAACPFGAYDSRVLKKLKKLNYERVYTSDSGPAQHDTWIQHRYSINDNDSIINITTLIDDYNSNKIKLLKRNIKSFIKSIR